MLSEGTGKKMEKAKISIMTWITSEWVSFVTKSREQILQPYQLMKIPQTGCLLVKQLQL